MHVLEKYSLAPTANRISDCQAQSQVTRTVTILERTITWDRVLQFICLTIYKNTRLRRCVTYCICGILRIGPFLAITQRVVVITHRRFETTYSVPSYLLTYLFTYLFTPWCRVLPEQLNGLQLVKKFPAFHGTWRFITALTSVRHLSLSCASPIQSTYPHPTSWRSILILSTHLRSPQWSPTLRFPHHDPIRPPLLTHTRHMPSPSHSSRFYHPHDIGWGVQII